ncbi:MAG: RNA pseudouridine synthase [Nitrospiraceae bacterium]|nr:RNA pseudouridine synthase [Nitrospiraceae bacterium]
MSKKFAIRRRHQPQGVIILHEDRDIIVVDKAPGLLTMGSDMEKERTVYYRMTDYVRKGNSKSRERLFIVHRLDRDVSGVLVLAKSSAAKVALQSNWTDAEKKYLAVVHGKPAEETGVISSLLAQNKMHAVYTTKDAKRGKPSSTAYRVVQVTEDFSLLQVTLLTGRKHQIRVQLADSGHPIVGDKRYGKGDKGYRRIALHAHTLAFKHPFSGERVLFETRIPRFFNALVGKIDPVLLGG